MSKNPLLNALAAAGYILLIVSLMTWGTSNIPGPDTIFAPLVAVSLFTLSAAIMGYIFCYEPILLLLDGKKKQAVQLFLHTVAIFACLTALAMASLFSGLLS